MADAEKQWPEGKEHAKTPLLADPKRRLDEQSATNHPAEHCEKQKTQRGHATH
jgi:hypothetical protein